MKNNEIKKNKNKIVKKQEFKRFPKKEINAWREQLITAKVRLLKPEQLKANQLKNLKFEVSWLENKLSMVKKVTVKKTNFVKKDKDLNFKNKKFTSLEDIEKTIEFHQNRFQRIKNKFLEEKSNLATKLKEAQIQINTELKNYLLKKKVIKTKKHLLAYKKKKQEVEKKHLLEYNEYREGLRKSVKRKKELNDIYWLAWKIRSLKNYAVEYKERELKKKSWHARKKQRAYEYKRIKHNWRKFFVVKSWKTSFRVQKLVDEKRNQADIILYKNKLSINTPPKQLPILINKFILKKFSYRLYYNKDWKAIKKKRKKKWISWYNFNFFFMKFYLPKAPKYEKYSGVLQEQKLTLINYPGTLSWHPRQHILVKQAQKFIKRIRPYGRLSYVKKTHWKKLALKRFFMGLYFINSLKKLKMMVYSSQKLHGHKKLNFFLYLESKIIPTCYRMNFFNTQRRALNWVYWGFIYRDGYVVKNSNIKINVNSLIRIILPKNEWEILSNRTLTRSKKSLRLDNLIFHYYELGLCYYIGIVLNIPNRYNDVRAFYLKKKKRWLQLKVFSYIANAYY